MLSSDPRNEVKNTVKKNSRKKLRRLQPFRAVCTSVRDRSNVYINSYASAFIVFTQSSRKYRLQQINSIKHWKLRCRQNIRICHHTLKPYMHFMDRLGIHHYNKF
jgi:hypothetical protein